MLLQSPPSVNSLAGQNRLADLRWFADFETQAILHAVSALQNSRRVDPQALASVVAKAQFLQNKANTTMDAAVIAACVRELHEARKQLETSVEALNVAQSYQAPRQGGMGSPPTLDELEIIRSNNRAALGLGAPLDFPVGNLFGQTVNKVTLKTSVTPEMSYAPGAPGQPAQVTNETGGPGEFVLKFLQPDLEIETPAGTVSVAPYGKPEQNYFWPAAVVSLLAGGALAYFAWVGFKTTMRRSK